MEEKGIDFLQNESPAMSVLPNTNLQSTKQGEQIKLAVETALEKIKKEHNQYIPLDFKIIINENTSITPLINENGTLGDEVFYSNKSGSVSITYDKLGVIMPNLNTESIISTINETAVKMNETIFNSFEDAIKGIAPEDIEKVTEIITKIPEKKREKVIEKNEITKETQEKTPNLGEKLQELTKVTEQEKNNIQSLKDNDQIIK